VITCSPSIVVASRLYFLKILKRSGLSSTDLLCFYKSVILSVIEYGCVVWHHNLTTAQSDRLEALQKRALRIILHPITLPYNTALAYCEIDSPKLRRNTFRKSSLNRFAILRTASMICSHLNVILLFLSGCGILQFILFPRLEQISIARSLTMHYRSITDECSMLMFKKCLTYSIYCDIPLFHVCKYFVHSLYILTFIVF